MKLKPFSAIAAAALSVSGPLAAQPVVRAVPAAGQISLGAAMSPAVSAGSILGSALAPAPMAAALPILAGSPAAMAPVAAVAPMASPIIAVAASDSLSAFLLPAASRDEAGDAEALDGVFDNLKRGGEESTPVAASPAGGMTQDAWDRTITEAHDLPEAYMDVMMLASLSYARQFSSNRRSYLSVNTGGGRYYELDAARTTLTIYSGMQHPRVTPDAVVKVGSRPEVQMRALLAADFLSELAARMAGDPKMPRLYAEGSIVRVSIGTRTGEFDAEKQILTFGGAVLPARTYSELARSLAQASGIPLPSKIDFAFDAERPLW